MFVPRRLDKYLRDATALSTAEIREACGAARVGVVVNGCSIEPRPSPEMLVFEDDQITLDGARIREHKQRHYLIFNKPKHLTTTANDPKHRANLGPYLRQMPPGVFAVGRLDRETTGALLLTNDGDFSNAILQPERRTEKEYWLWLDECLKDDDPRLDSFVKGVPMGTCEEPLRVSALSVVNQTIDYTELHVTLHEGKNRHLRKLCNVLGLRLLHLHRKRIASVHVEGLGPGQWRPLTLAEVESLWQNTGGQAQSLAYKIEALRRTADAARLLGTPIPRLEDWLRQRDAEPQPTADLALARRLEPE